MGCRGTSFQRVQSEYQTTEATHHHCTCYLYGLSESSKYVPFACSTLHPPGCSFSSDVLIQNPKDFVAPFDAFEFANFAKDSKAKLVICSMNWLASSPPEEDKHAQDSDTAPGGHRTELSNDAWEEVSDTLSYWATRLSPLIGTDALFIGCNRVGVEKGTAFTGSSCVMQLSKAPEVLAFAGKREERVLMARAVVQS